MSRKIIELSRLITSLSKRWRGKCFLDVIVRNQYPSDYSEKIVDNNR